jgi:hypothetical protein
VERSASGRLLEAQPLSLTAVVPDRTRVPRYGRVELTVNLHGRYANPYDPAEVELNGLVTTPLGHRLVVPGFYEQGYSRQLRGDQELLTSQGEPSWRIRICAQEVGRYRVIAAARDRTGRQVTSRTIRFTALPSTDPGFIRRPRGNQTYFAFDSGAAYLPIGANVCWGGRRGTFDYDRWLARYGQAKCTYSRLWLDPAWTTFALDRQGASQIDQANAWRLDYVLRLAEQHGIYLMLCLDSYNELRLDRDGASPFWERTPQNAANGGPLREPGEFWTSPEMDRLYRNKLRYLVARYGANPHVMAWEFWNEVDIVSPSAWNEDQVRAWHERMGRYLRGLDPYHHLITTSFSHSAGKPSIDSLPEIDFVQTHTYGARDLVSEIVDREHQKAGYGKPHYVGECGIGDHQQEDRNGVGLHNALWSGLFCGGAGSAMLWWWDNYIDPYGLYGQFAGLTRYIHGIDPIRRDLRPDANVQLSYAAPSAHPLLADLDLPARERSWDACPANSPTQVWVDRAGAVRVDKTLSGLLHGQKNHPALHNPVTFHLDLPRPSQLVVQVSGVSGYGGAHLVVQRNGSVVLDRDMPDPGVPGKPDTLHQYDGVYPVPIPAGSQTLTVENSGVDWMYVDYQLKNAVVANRPPLRVLALRGPDTALAWVQNPQSDWYSAVVEKTPPRPVPPTRLELTGLTDGRYEVTLWDTAHGAVIRQGTPQTAGGRLSVLLPTVTTDLAVKAVRQE